MKFITFNYCGQELAGFLSFDMQSAHTFSDASLNYDSLLEFIEKYSEQDLKVVKKLAENQGIPLSEITLKAPIPQPKSDIICVGLNYRDHLEESNRMHAGIKASSANAATYFSKRARVVTGPDEAVDSHSDVTGELDYEAELGVIIGKESRGVSEGNVWDHVFGLTCFNDYSARDLQNKHNQWYFGKSLDTFAAFGPWIVSIDEFDLPLKLSVESRVNGETRQKSNTELLIFSVEHIICELSRGISLMPGDIIATGTPAGVGAGFNPQRFLKPGDICEIEIEGCGVLRNVIR